MTPARWEMFFNRRTLGGLFGSPRHYRNKPDKVRTRFPIPKIFLVVGWTWDTFEYQVRRLQSSRGVGTVLHTRYVCLFPRRLRLSVLPKDLFHYGLNPEFPICSQTTPFPSTVILVQLKWFTWFREIGMFKRLYGI